jgi:hypothetical protein
VSTNLLQTCKVIGALFLIVGCVLGLAAEDLASNTDETTDIFGVSMLHPTLPDGAAWDSSTWSNGIVRSLTSRQTDPYDGWFTPTGSSGVTTILGDGTAKIVDSPRAYIQDPPYYPDIWRNVEATYYAKLIEAEDPPGHSGLKLGVRTDHGALPFNDCMGVTYYGILRYDGKATLLKELKHPLSLAGGITLDNIWGTDADGNALRMPEDKWIGIKVVVRNLKDDNRVKLELYRDMTGGVNGGKWELMLHTVDDGNWLASEGSTNGCAYEENYVNTLRRAGCFARFDGVDDLRMKWFSVREIEKFSGPFEYQPEIYQEAILHSTLMSLF